ncbi:MAG TPA: M56 family metallopeptidase, partial [Candidatus Baltobacteraceae bacterium]|nr:M56 family metallopeptidase [Candidatus Baltobacteraceae bacterium]
MNALYQIAPAVFAGAIASIVCGAVAIVAAHLTLRVCRLDRSAAARFALWFAALVPVALVLPAFVAAGSIRADAVSPTAVRALQIRPTQNITALIHLAKSRRAPATTEREAMGIPSADLSLRRTAITALSALWLAGFCLAAFRLISGVRRLAAIRRTATLLEHRPSPRGDVAVLNADLYSVPVALGYLHPAIVLPARFLSLDRATELEDVLMHEMEHLRRFDDVTALVQAACLAVLWFNPFAYYIAARLTLEREMACDEAVVERMGKRTRYAATLWKIATGATVGRAPGLLSAFASGASTVARMDNLLRSTQRARMRRIPVVLAALLQTA